MKKTKLVLSVALVAMFTGCASTQQPDTPKEEAKKQEIERIHLGRAYKYEKTYVKKVCAKMKGKIEHRLPDRTRVDCLTDEYAIEFDWAKKWAEGIGQSLHYSILTGKKPAVALISKHKKDARYLKRLKGVADKYTIKIFVVER